MEEFLQSIGVRFRQLSPARRRWMLAGTILSAFLLLFLLCAPQLPTRVHPGAPGHGSVSPEIPDANAPLARLSNSYQPQKVGTVPPRAELYKSAAVDFAGATADPHIVYSAELSILTKEFARSRTSIEEILDRHHGYVAKLRMVGQPSGSVLNATLRIPSSEYRSTLTDLKAVGNVEHEEECADEITQQYNNFEAQLLNAQNEERRLQLLLDNRSPKFTDYTPVERQLAQLRTEMQRIQTERNAYTNPIVFANISFSLQEERTAPAETLAAQLRSAALSGFGDVIGALSTVLLFVIGRGPILLLWAALLYFPTRYFWRRRALFALREAEAPKTT